MSMKELSELSAMDNQQLLDYVRSVSSDFRAADILTARWETFWEKDYVTLGRQRNVIENQEQTISELQKRVNRLQTVPRRVAKHVTGLEHATAKHYDTIDRLTRRVQILEVELAKAQKLSPAKEWYCNPEEHERLQKQVALLEQEVAMLRKQMPAPPKLRDQVQCIPAFMTYPNSPEIIARQVRLHHDGLVFA
jgi:hypothetical protein